MQEELSLVLLDQVNRAAFKSMNKILTVTITDGMLLGKVTASIGYAH